MEVIIKGFSRHTQRLTVSCDSTVGDLKQRISQDFMNLADDSRTLSSYGLSSKSTMMLVIMDPVESPAQVKAMDLIIKEMSGNTKHLSVDGNATVSDLKQLISWDLSVRPSEQKLSANIGQQINLDDDSRTLNSYGLKTGATVILCRKPGPMQVFVKNEKNQTSTYDVDAGWTVDQLQQKIFNKERVPVDQQRLIFDGKQLERGRMLKDYNITHQSTIYMTLRLRA